MPITRRDLLSKAALGTGFGALQSAIPVRLSAQDDPGAVVSRIHTDLVQHASFGYKFSGGPGDSATADWVATRLRGSGYRVDVSEFGAPFFVKRSTRLSIDAESVEVAAQAPVAPTPASGVTASLALVDGEGGEIGDVRGKIVLFLTPFGRHAALFPDRDIGRTITEIADRGAAAVVIVTRGPTGEAIALNAPEEGPFIPVPTAVLAPKHAERFTAAAREGRRATLVLDGDATHRPSKNIVARLERGNRWIGISTPRSGWYDCVSERGTGTAAFLALADWAARRFPDLSVFVMNTGGHEYFFAGSHRVLDQTPPPDKTLVWVHVGATLAARASEERDGKLVMLDTADAGRSLMATDAAREAVIESFQGLSGLTEPQRIRTNAGELSTFTNLGFTTAFAVLGLSPWFHTVEDTLDRTDAALIAPVLRAHQAAVEHIVARA